MNMHLSLCSSQDDTMRRHPLCDCGTSFHRAWLAWECRDGLDPLPRWKRYCGEKPDLLFGATCKLLDDDVDGPWALQKCRSEAA